LSIKRVEELVQTIENLPDPAARATAVALVQALMDFHGEALDRLMEIVASQGEHGYSIFDKFSGDEVVSNLLMLYGLHPLPLETRVSQALEKVKPHLASHGGDVELLEIAEGVVRLRLHGTCKGCPSSAETLKLAIEAAIYDAAPDVVAIQAEGALETSSHTGYVQIGKSNIADCRLPIENIAHLRT
jgi:Fe-S cluster biogenesis protein NfuA